MDVENLIPFIIAIAYFVISALTGKKKKKNQPSNPSNKGTSTREQIPQKPRPKPQTLEDLFKDALEQTQGQKPTLVPQVPHPDEIARRQKEEKIRIKKEKRAAEAKIKEDKHKQEVARREKLMRDLAASSKLKNKRIANKRFNTKKIAKSFNLKEAIIAKTILERPYK